MTLSQTEAVNLKRGSQEAAAAFRVQSTGYIYAYISLTDGSILKSAYVPVTLLSNPATTSIAID